MPARRDPDIESLKVLFSPSLPSEGATDSASAPHAAASRLIAISQEVPTVSDLVARLRELAADDTGKPIVDRIRIYTDVAFSDKLTGTDSSTDRLARVGRDRESDSVNRFGLVALSVPMASPATGQSDLTATFMNGVPTLELSRAVPFLDVRVLTARPPVLPKSSYLGGLTLYKQLLGSIGSNDTELALASGIEVGFRVDPNTATAGMELFTAPQLLVPVGRRYRAPLSDPYRGHATLQSFAVSSTSMQAGLLSFKTAQLELTIHDRARLADYADVLNPDFYANLRYAVTYGWSHPDRRSPYGKLVNQMRKTEEYTVQTSQFSFTPEGQVQVKVNLAANGAQEMLRIKVSNGSSDERFKSNLEEIQRLGQHIKELRDQVPGLSQSDPRFKEIRVQQIVTGAENAVDQVEVDPSLANDIAALFAAGAPAGDKSEAFSEILDSIKKLYGSDGRSGIVGDIRDSTAKQVETIMSDALKGEDIFLQHPDVRDRVYGPNPDVKKAIDDRHALIAQEIAAIKSKLPADPAKDNVEFRKGRQRLELLERADRFAVTSDVSKPFVSLGKLFQYFVVNPLVNSKKFREVQVFFYPLNDDAGAAGAGVDALGEARDTGANLACFAVDVSEFLTFYTQYARQKRSVDMTVAEFVKLVGVNIIDDPRSFMYGQQERFKPRDIAGSTTAPEPADNRSKKDKKGRESLFKTELDAVNSARPFRASAVECWIEAPHRDAEQDEVEGTRGIVRIHVFDQHATPYKDQRKLLSEKRDTELVNTELAELLARELDKPENAKKTGELLTAEAAKEFVRLTTPTVNYGTATSLVTSARLSTIQDSALNTVMILRGGKSNPLSPIGLNDGTIPLRILPTTLELDCLGVPTIEYANQLFVDFGTNTTADNIYGVIGIDHTIRPGEFSTKLRLISIDAWGKYETFRDLFVAESKKLKAS